MNNHKLHILIISLFITIIALTSCDNSEQSENNIKDSGFRFPNSIAVATDGDFIVTEDFDSTNQANENRLLAPLSLGSVIRVDQDTGNRTFVSNINRGSGPLFTSPSSIAVKPNGDFVLATTLTNSLFHIDHRGPYDYFRYIYWYWPQN